MLARLQRFALDGPPYDDWRLYALLWPWFLTILAWFCITGIIDGIVMPGIALYSVVEGRCIAWKERRS